jgi:hypothetical protein
MRKAVVLACWVQLSLGYLSFRYPEADIVYKVLSMASFLLVAIGGSMEKRSDVVDNLREQLIDSEKELLKTQHGESKKHSTADR